MGARVPATWLLMPGLDGTGRLFTPLLNYLPEGVRAQVVSYPTERPCNEGELLATIQAFIEATLPHEDFVIVAESFSGPLALRLAANNIPRLRAIILCASFGECPAPKASVKLLARIVHVCHLKIRIPDWVLRKFLLDKGCLELMKALREALHSVSAPALASRFHILSEYEQSSVPRQIDLPVLYIRAANDQVIGLREVLKLKKRLPSLSMVEIEAPHLLLQCRPAAAVKAIRKFLEGID